MSLPSKVIINLVGYEMCAARRDMVQIALSSPGKALPGEDKARTKSAPKPLQNTLHGKRA